MATSDSKKIVITGGHSTGIALLEEIKKHHPRWQIFYFGSRFALEGKKVPSFDVEVAAKIKGVKFIPFTTGRLQRRLSFYTLSSLLKIPYGFFSALVKLNQIRPDIIVSFGGYLSTPIVSAGWLLGIPSVGHEQTSTLGLANKINSFFVRSMAVSHPQQLAELPAGKGIYTGMLGRSCLCNKSDSGNLGKVRQAMQKGGLPLLFITGGKTGAQTVNNFVLPILEKLLQKFVILHQTGKLDLEKFRHWQAERKFLPYFPVDFLADKEWGWAINNASLLVSRAGANVTFEIMALHKPAIMIPIPWSYKNEQEKNATLIEKSGGGVKLDQGKLTSELLQEQVISVFRNRKKLSQNLQKVKVKDGRQALLHLIEKVLGEKNI